MLDQFISVTDLDEQNRLGSTANFGLLNTLVSKEPIDPHLPSLTSHKVYARLVRGLGDTRLGLCAWHAMCRSAKNIASAVPKLSEFTSPRACCAPLASAN